MIDLKRKLKNFGPLEALVLSSLVYVVIMLIWTASTRSAVVQKYQTHLEIKVISFHQLKSFEQ